MENLKHMMTLPGLLFFSRIRDSPKSEPTQSCIHHTQSLEPMQSQENTTVHNSIA